MTWLFWRSFQDSVAFRSPFRPSSTSRSNNDGWLWKAQYRQNKSKSLGCNWPYARDTLEWGFGVLRLPVSWLMNAVEDIGWIQVWLVLFAYISHLIVWIFLCRRVSHKFNTLYTVISMFMFWFFAPWGRADVSLCVNVTFSKGTLAVSQYALEILCRKRHDFVACSRLKRLISLRKRMPLGRSFPVSMKKPCGWNIYRFIGDTDPKKQQ